MKKNGRIAGVVGKVKKWTECVIFVTTLMIGGVVGCFVNVDRVSGFSEVQKMDDASDFVDDENLDGVSDFVDDENLGSALDFETGERPEIYIKAINPGYTIDGKQNIGEMIEIVRTELSENRISLAGITLDYTNSSGTTTTIVEFPEHSWMTGETILLRLASSVGDELAAMTYAKTLAMKAGPLELKRNGEILDTVCWTGKDGCFAEFKSARPTSLVRESYDADFVHVENYTPKYAEGAYLVEEDEEVILPKQCAGVVFSEILSFYESARSEQFVELYNPGAEQILLDGCKLRYKNKMYPLEGIIAPEGYFVRTLGDFYLTKNPTTVNILEVIDADGERVAKAEYPNGQRKGTSWALVGYDADGAEIWRTTYVPTPGEANNYQEYKTCEAGKVINETTGNCVKITEVVEKTCDVGEYLNPLTGRCKKYETAKTATVCKEGYELNPLTNRCRKIKDNNGADYAIIQEKYEESSSFVALYIVIGVVVIGIIYIIWEYRKEIKKIFYRKK